MPDPHGTSRLLFSGSRLRGASNCSMSLSQPCGSCRQQQEIALHWRYAGTPTESHIQSMLQEWLALESLPATSPRPSACSIRGATVVILQATQESASAWRAIIEQIGQLRSLLHARKRPAPLFLIMDRTDVSHPAGWETRPDPLGLQRPTALKDISSFERWLLRETQGVVAGVAAIPVSAGTVQGIASGLLRHEPGSAWHFMDPGRIYLAQVMLNTLRLCLFQG